MKWWKKIAMKKPVEKSYKKIQEKIETEDLVKYIEDEKEEKKVIDPQRKRMKVEKRKVISIHY